MKKFEVAGHAPSYLPEGEWELAWSDEFDGCELDRTKWDFRVNFWGKKFPGYTTEGVIVRDSCVELHVTERDGKYVSPQLQTGCNSFDVPSRDENETAGLNGEHKLWPLGTLEPPKFAHRYGYYECRCKLQKNPQLMWSAFWMQSPAIGTRFEPEWCGVECDIMENFKPGIATTGNIVGGYGPQKRNLGRHEYDLTETEDGWHYFGMDWQPDGYVFYCDGVEVTRDNTHVSHVPEFLLITTEVKGWRGPNGGRAVEGEFEDDAFIVDFVRVYDKK